MLPRVVLLVLDGFPNRYVTADIAPTLVELARVGGRADGGGTAVMTSATYPNHATFVTGTGVSDHGLYANHVVRAGTIHPAETVGPDGPTIFDELGAAGFRTECVVGDHHLVGTMAADRAGRHWPEDGRRPNGPYDVLGYVADSVTVTMIVEAVERRPDFLFAHLNEPDTAGHVFGPDRPRALEVFAATDRYVARIVDALDWDATVLVVVSDHDMEAVLEPQPVDLSGLAAAAGCPAIAVHEGSGATLVHDAPFDTSWLDEAEGIGGYSELGDGLLAVTAGEGRWFGEAPIRGLRGVHGGERTRPQVAIVSGGHPAAPAIARSLRAGSPDAADWAVTVGALLGVGLPRATGRDLANGPRT